MTNLSSLQQTGIYLYAQRVQKYLFTWSILFGVVFCLLNAVVLVLFRPFAGVYPYYLGLGIVAILIACLLNTGSTPRRQHYRFLRGVFILCTVSPIITIFYNYGMHMQIFRDMGINESVPLIMAVNPFIVVPLLTIFAYFFVRWNMILGRMPEKNTAPQAEILAQVEEQLAYMKTANPEAYPELVKLVKAIDPSVHYLVKPYQGHILIYGINDELVALVPAEDLVIENAGFSGDDEKASRIPAGDRMKVMLSWPDNSPIVGFTKSGEMAEMEAWKKALQEKTPA